MSYKSCLAFLSVAFVALFFGAGDAHACSCAGKPTVLDAYEAADYVVVTRVVSVEKAEKAAPEGGTSNGENYVDGVKSTRMIVERVYKGNLKAGEEITLGQGGGADCIWTFSEKEIGEQYLFYLDTRQKNSPHWYAFACGRSNGLDYATDDLLYLNKLDKVRGKTRISGTIRFKDNDEWSIEGRRIRFSGAGKTYEVKTNKKGVYEIYDLPAGRYLVEPELPPGWKVDANFLSYSNGFAGDPEADALKQIPVVLNAKKHVALDLRFEIDNTLRGKVYDPDGKLLKDVCLALVPAGEPLPSWPPNLDCTEANGAFEIKKIPAGSYVLAVNPFGKVSSREPFKTFYYPDVVERERATIITIGAGDSLEGFDVRVPKLEQTVTVEGVFLYSDGKPVAGERVEFKVADSEGSVDGGARGETDAKGRFSIKILKGLKGELTADMFTYVGEFKNCPALDALVKKSGAAITTIKAEAVEIRAEGNLKDVELRFPFPRCEKANRPEASK